MNRRDYLKQMGLATAVTIGSNHLAGLRAFAGTSSADDASQVDRNHDSSNSNDVVAPQARTGEWPTGSEPDPANFGVKLIFSGMCIFGYKGKVAHVAFHRGHTNRHKMQIIVSKKGTECTDIYPIGDRTQPVHIHKSEVGIKDKISVGIKDKISDANFFLGSEFVRKSNRGHALDFRWLLDLEGPEFYKKELKPKNDKQFSTKLRVRHGTFYTYQRTNTTFEARGGPSPGYLGRIAKVMAANIHLNDGESVYLRINGKNVIPYLTNQAQYEIYFLNERESGNDPDFDMVFDEMDDPGYKFTLHAVGPPKEEATTDLCHNLPLVARATDEAPCMGAGFGSGNGLG